MANEEFKPTKEYIQKQYVLRLKLSRKLRLGEIEGSEFCSKSIYETRHFKFLRIQDTSKTGTSNHTDYVFLQQDTDIHAWKVDFQTLTGIHYSKAKNLFVEYLISKGRLEPVASVDVQII